MDKNNGVENLDGRLVGWLVSYGLDDSGAAYEIRSGRSLVSSGQSVSNTTVVVEEGSISNPHLALRASDEHAVFVQDIFSDAGSFIVRSGESEETPITGPIEIAHGDWIRVGENVRFQVCLIDGGSR